MNIGWALLAISGWTADTADARQDRAPFAVASVSDQARAKALAVQADKAVADGRFAEGAATYERAWQLSGDQQLLLKMAGAYESAGDLVRALETLDWYRARAPHEELTALRERRDRLAARLVAGG